MENFSDERNRKNLELAVAASRDDSRGEQPSVLITPRTDSISTEWTDVKHSLYLKSMETSFIKDLYKSAKNISSKSQKHYNTNIQLSKFKVLSRGCWQRIVFEGERPLLSKPVKKFGYQGVLGSPWIQHFRSLKIHTVENFPFHEENKANTNDQAINLRRGDLDNSNPSTSRSNIRYSNLCLNNLSGSDREEVSDQNFVEEDSEEAYAGNDLVVPYKESRG